MFKSHAIVSQDGKQIMYLYLNTMDTEFANELSAVEPSSRTGTLVDSVYGYISEKGLEDLPCEARIMMGSLMLNAIEIDSNRLALITEPDFENYEVKLGDTLHKVSQKFDVSIWEIKQVNQLVGNLIFRGQVLKIPLRRAVDENIYVVKEGDTLNKIARSFLVDVRKLKQANNLVTSRIEIGQMLKVPTGHLKRKTYLSDADVELRDFASRMNIAQEKIRDWNNKMNSVVRGGERIRVYTNPKHGTEVAGYSFVSDTYIKMQRVESGRVEVINLERYVLGVVASEMPANFSIEALKAQAVASRSYIVYRLRANPDIVVNDSVDYQTYSDLEELRAVWMEYYDENLAKVAKAVFETRGEVAMYDGAVIDAIFHPASHGKTISAKKYWGVGLPYLVSVDSGYDGASPFCMRKKQLPLETFNQLLNCDVSQDGDIKLAIDSETGAVDEVLINGQLYGAVEVKDKLHLNSLSFGFSVEGNAMKIEMCGWGHGVGMSQYGANGMALKGHDYRSILRHYYSGVEVASAEKVGGS